MKLPVRHCRGYTIVELLVVLVIVGILALASVYMIRPRTTDSVRAVMSEVEITLLNAQNSANISTQDIYVASRGTWLNGSLIIDARPLVTTGVNAVSNPPLPSDLIPGSATSRVGSPAECFRSRYLQSNRDHMSAGIATDDSWLTIALGSAPTLQSRSVFTALPGFTTAMSNQLCYPATVSTDPTWVVLNGVNRRFLTGFSIVVVGLANGIPVPNGPVGVLVVPAGGATIYKYFKPNGSNVWGRL
jgi:prepilin-type N-terminal cleavage/methylation domain-containing protein